MMLMAVVMVMMLMCRKTRRKLFSISLPPPSSAPESKDRPDLLGLVRLVVELS